MKPIVGTHRKIPWRNRNSLAQRPWPRVPFPTGPGSEIKAPSRETIPICITGPNIRATEDEAPEIRSLPREMDAKRDLFLPLDDA